MADILRQDRRQKEWNSLPKNWFSIYQWSRTNNVRDTEWIAARIEESFDSIQLITDGVRENNFKTPNHCGQVALNTEIGQFTEKRFVRALFNMERLQPLGMMVDYEVPLKATKESKHGDIDLLCVSSNAVLCVEAKDPRKSTSILKAILQAFVYTSFAVRRREAFKREFGLTKTLPLTPAVLVGMDARRQLDWDRYKHLGRVVNMLNAKLAKSGVGAMRFFVVQNEKSELESCLRIDANKKVHFVDGFVPDVFEWLHR